MSGNPTTTRSSAIILEEVPCPRCGQQDSVLVYRARDYIYGMPGEYFASCCRACTLLFQNPRPIPEQLADLYPDSYAAYHGVYFPPQPAAGLRPVSPFENSTSVAPSPTSSNNRSITSASGLSWQVWKNWSLQMLRKLPLLRQARRGWTHGYLVHRLGYYHLQGSGVVECWAARFGAILSYTARWQAGVNLIPHFVPGGRLLEIGCGNGSRLLQLRELGWENLSGVELSSSTADAVRQLGFDVYAGPIEDALAEYPDEHFDVVVSSMVLEHLLNPFEIMRRITRMLKPGKELLFSTVIRDSLDGYLFGPYGVSYDFPRHMVFFRKKDLYDILEGEFDHIRCFHQNSPIDFQRPARLRGGKFDHYIFRFFQLPGARWLVWLLAQLRLMGRVSFRCIRKSPTRNRDGS